MYHGQPLKPGDLTRIATTITNQYFQLKRLKIVFAQNDHQITAADIKNFAYALKTMKHLQRLTFDFMYELKASESNLSKLIGGIKSARELKALSFDFGSQINFGQLAGVSLANSLNNLVNLTRFTLLVDSAISYPQLSVLALALAKFTKLTFLELNLKFKEGYHGLDKLSDSLVKFVNLTHLKLNLYSNWQGDDDTFMPSSDTEIMQLATAIGTLAQLSCLSLRFKQDNMLSNLGLESLGSNLAKLANLTRVDIDANFGAIGYGNSTIDAIGMQLLMDGLRNQTNLIRLSLALSGIMGLEPAAYQQLANLNPNLTNYSLQLFLVRFTDSCFDYLAAGLHELINLKELRLEILTNQGLALNGLINLINSLDHLANLQLLNLQLIVNEKPKNYFIDVPLLKASMAQLYDALPSLQSFTLHIRPGANNYKNCCDLIIKRNPTH
jgi:hypothetical protein